MRLHRVWGIAYIKEVCGEPPQGCEVGEMWEDSDYGPAASIGLRWDPTEIEGAPWDYINKAEVALHAMDDAIDWSILAPEAVQERIKEAEARLRLTEAALGFWDDADSSKLDPEEVQEQFPKDEDQDREEDE